MKTRRIADVPVSAIGLGGMPMSIEGRPDRERSIRTVHTALDAGVTLIDTADAYHLHADEIGHNEELIAEALRSWSGDASTVLVATKGGHLRPGDGSWTVDGRPEHIREAAKASLARLGGDAIGLYQFHRPDPEVPYADSVGAVRDLLDEGVIRLAGISNANPEQIRLALAGELGIAFLPWSPLGGITNAADLGSRFEPFREVAEARGVSPQVVALAWHLAQGEHVIPIPGSSRPETIRDSLTAVDIILTPDERARLTAA